MVDDYCLQPTAIDQAFYKPSNSQLFYPAISGNNLTTIAQTNSMYSQDLSQWNSNTPLVDYRLFSSNNMRYNQRNNGNLSPSILYNPLVNVSSNHLACLTESPFTTLYGKHQYNLFNNTPNTSVSSLNFSSTRNSLRFTFEENSEKPKKPHIKKPLNAFMLFMKEMRAKVVAECTLKESAAINQILGRRWHALSREEQAKYYEMARKEKELHHQLYPGWSARDNYATQVKRKKKRQGLTICNTSKIIKDLSKRDKGSRENITNQPWIKNSPMANLPNQTAQVQNDINFPVKPVLTTESSKMNSNSSSYVSSMMSPFSCSSFPIFSPPSHVQLPTDLESYNLSYGSPAFQNSFCPPPVNYPNQLPPIFDQTFCQAIRLEQSAGRSN